MDTVLILQPLIAMAILTLFVALRMLCSRVTAMRKLKIHPQQGQDAKKLNAMLPSEVARIANNYNHLFEQPVIFYVICLALAVMQQVDEIHIWCAWLYTALRFAHSWVQTTIDYVMLRFVLFVMSWMVLAVMLVRVAIYAFGI